MLEALYEQGIRPDLLFGTSAGAINAAFVASRRPTVRTARTLQQIWRGLNRSHVFPANPLTAGLACWGHASTQSRSARSVAWSRAMSRSSGLRAPRSSYISPPPAC